MPLPFRVKGKSFFLVPVDLMVTVRRVIVWQGDSCLSGLYVYINTVKYNGMVVWTHKVKRTPSASSHTHTPRTDSMICRPSTKFRYCCSKIIQNFKMAIRALSQAWRPMELHRSHACEADPNTHHRPGLHYHPCLVHTHLPAFQVRMLLA